MNKKITLMPKHIWLMLTFFLIGGIAFSYGLLKYGNSPMALTEYIYEYSLKLGSNSELELNLFWSIMFGGIAIISLIFFLIKKKMIREECVSIGSTESRIIVLGTMSFFAYIYNGYLTAPLIFGLVVAIFSIAFGKEISDKFFYGFICLVGALLAISYLFCKNSVNTVLVMLLALFLIASLCYLIKMVKFNFFNKIMLIMQCMIPLMLLVYLKDKYIYGEETIIIENNMRTKAFWWGIIVVMIIIAVVHAVKKWNKDTTKMEDIIVWTSCASFAGISIYYMVGRFVTDQHHLAENTISFNQIFRHHLTPYVDYFPVSGLYPVVVGGIQELLGLSLTGALMAQSVFAFIVMLLIVWLGCKYLNKKYVLLLALIIPFALEYTRTNLILVYLLILFLPSLRSKLGYWIEAWAALTFIIVFFYPLYGVAALTGVLPLGIYQCVMFFKKGEYKDYFKKIPFCLILILEVIVILLSIPSILGVINHTLVYADNSMLCNAWSTFGRVVPAGFFSWLTQYPSIRTCIWYVLRYMVPVVVVWFLLMFALKFIKGNHIVDVLKDSEGFHLSFSAMATLVVSCTYTMQRLEEQSLLSRTAAALFPSVTFIFCILIFKHINKNVISMILLGLICSLSYVGTSSFLTNSGNVFDKNQTVFADYIYISSEEAEQYVNLGEGFIPSYMNHALNIYKQNSTELLAYDSDLSFIGMDLAYLTALDLKTAGQPSIYAVMTYKQSAEELKSINKIKPVIILDYISPIGNYYLYNWLVNSTEYAYSAKYNAYLPLELAEKIGLPEDNRINSIWACTDVGNTAASAGKSMKTLQENYEPLTVDSLANDSGIFSTTNEETGITTNYNVINVTFNQSVIGTEGDYLYVDLKRSNGNKSNLSTIENKIERNITKEIINEGCVVTISWAGEADRANFINCTMSDGRLLIPLGSNINWLLAEHDGFIITVSGLDEGETVSVGESRMMKSMGL